MQNEAILIISLGFILGTILGSFVKVLADRSLSKRSFKGRSYCVYCKKHLDWYDLIPIISYLYLSGKCRYCQKNFSIEYLLVEIVMGILVGFLFWQSSLPPFGWNTIATFNLILKIFSISILVALFLTDLKKMFIPDRIIIPAIILAVIGNLLLIIFKTGYLFFYLSQNVVGRYLLPPNSDFFRRHALIIVEPFLYSVVVSVAIAGFFLSLIIITRGKGMGGGDVKLGAFLGLMLGFPNALLALVLSFVLGAAFSLLLILTGRKHFGQTIAFGPFLVIGALIALFWGNQIIEWYLLLGT